MRSCSIQSSARFEDALAADLPLKDAEGNVPAPDRFAVELAAIALLRVRRCWAYLELHGDADERGHMRSEFIELGKAIESAARMLDRLGMSPRAGKDSPPSALPLCYLPS
jgi:hypothetical protein